MLYKSSLFIYLFISFREGEELFQFLFLETEIKNSWEAYFEDAKQKLGEFFISNNYVWYIISFSLVNNDYFFTSSLCQGHIPSRVSVLYPDQQDKKWNAGRNYCSIYVTHGCPVTK